VVVDLVADLVVADLVAVDTAGDTADIDSIKTPQTKKYPEFFFGVFGN